MSKTDIAAVIAGLLFALLLIVVPIVLMIRDRRARKRNCTPSAGEHISAGDAVYLDVFSGKVYRYPMTGKAGDRLPMMKGIATKDSHDGRPVEIMGGWYGEDRYGDR